MSEPLCRHETITTWGTSANRLWACTSCSRRFYPACETCVDVGHRNETHPLAAPAEGLREAVMAAGEAQHAAHARGIVYREETCASMYPPMGQRPCNCGFLELLSRMEGPCPDCGAEPGQPHGQTDYGRCDGWPTLG